MRHDDSRYAKKVLNANTYTKTVAVIKIEKKKTFLSSELNVLTAHRRRRL